MQGMCHRYVPYGLAGDELRLCPNASSAGFPDKSRCYVKLLIEITIRYEPSLWCIGLRDLAEFTF
jgi:hypothetical protein